MSIQIVKYLATDSQREELSKCLHSSGDIILHTSYPTVTVNATQFRKIEYVLSVSNRPKGAFKQAVMVLIPDGKIWAKNNGSYMLDNF